METTVAYWGYIGIMEKKMESTTVYKMEMITESHFFAGQAYGQPTRLQDRRMGVGFGV